MESIALLLCLIYNAYAYNIRQMDRQKSVKIQGLLDSLLPHGKIELTDPQIEKLKNAGELVLGLSVAAGAIAMSLLAPNALQLLKKMPWSRSTYRSRLSKKRDQRRALSKSFYYLRQRGYIELFPKNDDFLVKITERGRQRILEIGLRNLQIKKPAKWDGAWWIIIGDIPTNLRSQANAFRRKLKELKVSTLQRSVWVYPFDPRNEISFLAALNGIERYITTFRATDLESEDEASLKKIYGL